MGSKGTVADVFDAFDQSDAMSVGDVIQKKTKEKLPQFR